MSYIGNEPIVSATRTVTEVTATAGQTVFNANGGYTVGYLDVFLNGAQLQTVDFTATNGSSVTLTEAAQAGDVVRLVAWGTFQSANLSGAGLLDGTVTQAKLSSGVAGNGPAFKAFQSGGQSFSAGTDTKMVLNSEVFDTAGVFNNTGSTVGGNPSYSFMPNVAGYYQISGRVGLALFSYDWGFCSIWKNNALIARGSASNTTSFSGSVVSDIVYLNGTTDYVNLYMITNTGSPETENAGGAQFMTYFSGALVRAA